MGEPCNCSQSLDLVGRVETLEKEILGLKKTKIKPDASLLDRLIVDCDFTVRTANALRLNGYHKISDLNHLSRFWLARKHNIGIRTLKEIDEFMEKHGLSFEFYLAN